MALLVTQVLTVDGQRNGEVLAFDFGYNQFAVVGAQDGCSLAHTGRAHVLGDGVAWIGHLNGSQLFAAIDKGTLETDNRNVGLIPRDAIAALVEE